MSDHKTGSVKRIYERVWGGEILRCHGRPSLLEALEAEGWTPPPAPKPTLAISEAVRGAYRRGGVECDDISCATSFAPCVGSLRAAIRVWLKEALLREYSDLSIGGFTNVNRLRLYRALTGEEWPS